jgi:hypothetical protein
MGGDWAIEEELRAARRQGDLPDRVDDALKELGRVSERLEQVLLKFEPPATKRIFLSHARDDKEMVRRFLLSLRSVGLDPWLDEENMPAGTSVHRGIQQGLRDSAAAVFFITSKFSDEGFLRKEIDYAVDEQRKRPEEFRIISLVMGTSAAAVPSLLSPFVWKEPQTELESFVEIIRAIPLRPGPGTWIKVV